MNAWISRIVRSKTMMFNIFIALMGSGEAIFGFLQPHIPGNIYGWGMAILTIGNAIIRAVWTTQPLRDK